MMASGRIIFLLEEPSMKYLLEGLLPRIFPGLQSGQHFLCVPHQGKSDLDASIPKKLKAWQIEGDRFVILRDTDGANCLLLKARFVAMCSQSRRPDTLIRLVCQELEAWYLGDLLALAEVFQDPKLNTPVMRKRFADPDAWQKPADQLTRMISGFQKGATARAMAKTLESKRNTSRSFQVFVDGLSKMVSDLGIATSPH